MKQTVRLHVGSVEEMGETLCRPHWSYPLRSPNDASRTPAPRP